MSPRPCHKVTNKKRMTVVKAIACLSLATGAVGFTSTSLHPPSRPLHLQQQQQTGILAPTNGISLLTLAMGASSSSISGSKRTSSMSSSSSAPRLTREEEVELLRQAAELRRLNQLEAEMAIRGQLPLLSVRAKAAGYGEELEDYENAKLDGQKAREELVTRNMGLVQYCVTQILHKKKHLNSLSREDLVQEGAIGLARAVDKYNPSIGGKFSTYAVYWIRAAILRCIAERDDLLRVPSHVSQAVHEINKAARRLGMDLDGSMYLTSSSWKEAQEAKRLAEEAGLSERNFDEAMKVRNRRYTGGYIAFESWMQKGENLVSDVPVVGDSSDHESPTSALEREQLRKTLSQFLRPKEMEALSWRYGLVHETSTLTTDSSTPQQRANQYLAEAEEKLFGPASSSTKMAVAVTAPTTVNPSSLPAKGRFGEAMSFHEVGKKMKVSAEYGRKLCHAGLAKLRQAAEDGRLEPALLF